MARRTYSKTLLVAAAAVPGIGEARARQIVAAIRPDLPGMLVYLASDAAQGATEADWLTAFPTLRTLVPGVPDEAVAGAVMEIVARLVDGLVVESAP